uniref:Uncharacterized protein n=1 Tax=Plectus sambesii TaxID=2011161 RepID=A0A914W483_9BILA
MLSDIRSGRPQSVPYNWMASAAQWLDGVDAAGCLSITNSAVFPIAGTRDADQSARGRHRPPTPAATVNERVEEGVIGDRPALFGCGGSH